MLWWSAMFLLVAVVAAVVGFGGIAEGAAITAQVIFFIFVGLFVMSLAIEMLRSVRLRQSPRRSQT